MPSPFPGMDPFLEHPGYFPGLHEKMVVYIAEQLQSRLPDPYFADLGERVWVETSSRRIEPDVDVFRRRGGRSSRPEKNGGPAVATRSKPIIITVLHDESHESFVEIRTRAGDQERLVATIEVLSPSNKTPGEKAQGLYRKKQREIEQSGSSHLIEIDLLRAGKHTTSVPLTLLKQKASPFDYHVCVRPFDKPGKFEIYAIELPDPLPEMAIPLLPGDGEVPLDLQAVFNRCYDVGPYRKRVRYTLDRIEPPLPRKRLAWAKQILRTKATEQAHE
jgi:hypothetical protein